MNFLGQECQTNGTEYIPIGRRKKKQQMSNGNDDDDDQYVDLSDDEIVLEDDDDDDLSDLYPGKFYFICQLYTIDYFVFLDFRRLRASDVKARMTTTENNEDGASGQKRKAQTSQVRNKRMIRLFLIDDFIFR